jgi:hypothetical protein
MEVRKMAEKQYEYKTKIKQPQTVVNVKIAPEGGILSEREYKTVKKDVYGVSLLEKGLLEVKEVPVKAPDTSDAHAAAPASSSEGDGVGESVPDFETHDVSEDRSEDHAGWEPK